LLLEIIPERCLLFPTEVNSVDCYGFIQVLTLRRRAATMSILIRRLWRRLSSATHYALTLVTSCLPTCLRLLFYYH